MSDLTDILAQALGCTPGARGCLTHGHTWPCDRLTDTEADVRACIEEEQQAEYERTIGSLNAGGVLA